MTFKENLANFVLGNISTQQLIDVATQALTEGRDSSSLRMLAAEDEIDYNPQRINALLNRSLQELNISLPQKEDAIWSVLCFYIRNIAERAVSVREGMSLVLDNVYYKCNLREKIIEYVGDSHDIHELIANYWGHDNLDERPDEVSFDGRHGKAAHDALDEYIVELAKTWVKSHCNK